MKFKSRAPLAVSLIAAACLFGVGAAHSAATIINTAGTLALGVNDEGHLNTDVGNVAVNSSRTGLAYKFADGAFRDATSPGCFCEGWGVSVNNTTSGYANVSVDGVVNLTVDSFVSGATTATSAVHLTSLSGLTVTHAYSEADNAPSALFKSVVTIKNSTGATVTDVKYVRVMDWDVPPTEFDEFVTIKGTATTTLLENSHDDGFQTGNPLSTFTVGGGPGAGTVDVDFTDNGSTDHGAYFRFNFGDLADGAEYSFTIFYGATASESTAIAAIAAESIELYSLGQNSRDPTGGTPATFIFGFKGVGGQDIENVPEPGSLALVGLGLLGAGALRRRGSRRQA